MPRYSARNLHASAYCWLLVGVRGFGGFDDTSPLKLFADRCFLHIDYEGSSYIGCLLCSEHGFCKSLVRVLEAHVTRASLRLAAWTSVVFYRNLTAIAAVQIYSWSRRTSEMTFPSDRTEWLLSFFSFY